MERVISTVFEDAGAHIVLERPHPLKPQIYKIRVPSSKETLLLEYYPALAPHQVEGIYHGFRQKAMPGVQPGIIVQRLSGALMEACKKNGIPVMDLGGNAWLRLPGIYIERLRSGRSSSQERSTGTVFSAKASRTVRALLASYPTEWTQARLSDVTDLSRGFMSTLWARLLKEGYASVRGKAIHLEAPDRLLEDWTAHYRFDRHRRLYYALNMTTYEEGLHKVSSQLQKADVKFAYTGWSGGHLRAPYAIPSSIMAYVNRKPQDLNSLFPVERQGNVVLIIPNDEGVFQFTQDSGFGAVVSDPQLYVDLCRMPGRAQDQADAIRHQHLRFAEGNP